MKQKFPLYEALAAIDLCDFNFYNRQTPDMQKEFSAWLLMRFASSSTSHPEHYLIMVNEIVNKYFTDVSKHPELQWKLLASCGVGKKTQHPWIPPTKKEKVNKMFSVLADRYPHRKRDELEMLLGMLSDDEKLEMLLDMGYNDAESAEIMNT